MLASSCATNLPSSAIWTVLFVLATLPTCDACSVKAYVVRAEDARLLGDMKLMRKMYAELYALNKRLLADYAKRANNHQVSFASLCR